MSNYSSSKYGLALALVLAGCSQSSLPQKASYQTSMEGKFSESRKFTATITIVADYQEGTFQGVIDDFRFTRRGFSSPSGYVPISGTISRGSDGEILFAGSGEGRLTQNSISYEISFEMESSYIDPEFDSVLFWYFGGGEFARRGNYLGWPSVEGTFQAPAICKQTASSEPCPTPEAVIEARTEQ